MHVLGHSFGQKCRRSKRPRDLHIRKVSFSGSSVSGCSLSSSDSTASACTAFIPPQYADHAPLRLHERPFKAIPSPTSSRRSFFEPTAFYDDDIDADDAAVDDGSSEDELSERDVADEQPFDMEMPPHASPMDHAAYERQDPTDYFFFKLAARPPMPPSRWSESTIQSVQTIDHIPTPGSTVSSVAASEPHEDQGPPVVVEMPPNYTRAVSAPSDKRPPMPSMDNIQDFVKRGGWKRRGIVFRHGEVDTNDNRLSN